MTEEMILCPACEQDWMIRAKIAETHEPIRICPECDNLALGHSAKVSAREFDFATFMKNRGGTGSWNEIVVVDLWRFPEQSPEKPFDINLYNARRK